MIAFTDADPPTVHLHWTFTGENGYRSCRWFPTEQEARDGAELVGSMEPEVYSVVAPNCPPGNCNLLAVS